MHAVSGPTTYLASFPSPPQGVWHIGPVALRAYALCIIAGIIVGVIWGSKRYVARGGKPGRIADLAVFAVPFGLIGGRLYHVITDHELYFGEGRNPWRAFAIWEGGLGIWGAIALGAVGIWWGCRHYKIPMGPVADAMAPGIVLAQAIGRLGNYFNQELFGAQTDLPWGLEVFVRTPGGGAWQGDAPPVDLAGAPACEFATEYIKANPEVICGTFHPTFLYELLWNVAVALLIVWADKKFRLGGGRVFALYVAGYTAGRGWIEALRIDIARTHVFGLRVNIVVSIVVFLLAVAFLIWKRKVGREEPAYVRGEHLGGADADRDGTDDPGEPDKAARSAAASETADESAVAETADADRPEPEPDTEAEGGSVVIPGSAGVADPDDATAADDPAGLDPASDDPDGDPAPGDLAGPGGATVAPNPSDSDPDSDPRSDPHGDPDSDPDGPNKTSIR